MSTYNTYQEAKIANPESEIVRWNKSDKYKAVSKSDLSGYLITWSYCDPADYCVTVEKFLRDGHKFVDGDLIYSSLLDLVINVTKDELMDGESYPEDGVNTLMPSDDKRYILRAAALEQPKQEVEWKNGDECVICDDDFSVVVGCEKYIGEAGVVFGSHVNAKGFNLTLVEFKDGGCFAFMTEMLRKPKSERELVIEQIVNVLEENKPYAFEEIAKALRDTFDIKPIQE